MAFGGLRGLPQPAVSCKFPKRSRLLQAASFSAVFQQGKKQSGRYFALFIRVNGLEYPRLGLVVAKKNIRLATTRNCIKRVLRESFRHYQVGLGGIDIVCVIYQPANVLSASELREQIDKQWAKLISCKKA